MVLTSHPLIIKSKQPPYEFNEKQLEEQEVAKVL